MSCDVVVIIPMFNSAKTIKRALMSIANQTILPIRVVVVDDGSTDDSCDVVRECTVELPFLLDIISQKNAGPSAARNVGINSSNEELVCFLDADDEWLSTKLEKQVALYRLLIEKKKQVGIIECFSNDIAGNTSNIQDSPVLSGNHFKNFLDCNVIKGTACVMIPRCVLNYVGGFDSSLKFGEDRMLWTSIAEKYELHTVKEVLVIRYIGNEGNITSNPSANYIFKKKFSVAFITKFSHLLTRKEIVRFQLLNLNEFLVTFYSRKQYVNVVICYQDMLKISYSALWVSHLYPTLKFLIAKIKLLQKWNKNER